MVLVEEAHPPSELDERVAARARLEQAERELEDAGEDPSAGVSHRETSAALGGVPPNRLSAA